MSVPNESSLENAKPDLTYFVDEKSVIEKNDALVAQSETVTDHITMINATLALLSLFFSARQAKTADESALMVLGARVYNSSAAALHITRSGYYQIALMLVRDMIEAINLLDYFHSHKREISNWRTLPDKQRRKQFGPQRIRDILNKRDQLERDVRNEYYSSLSGMAVHPTFQGVSLLVRDEKIMVGPFSDARLIEGVFTMLTKFVVFGAQMFLRHFDDVVEKKYASMVPTYNAIFLKWQKKHLPDAVFRKSTR